MNRHQRLPVVRARGAVAARAAGLIAVLAAATLGALLAGCDNAEPEEQTAPSLRLTWLPAFRKAGGPAGRQVSNEIDLGDIPSGRDYYFSITNGGDVSIQDVRVELSADSGFSVSPSFFDTVPPRARGDAMSIIRLSVVHGTASGPVIVGPLLEQGRHTLGVSLNGTVEADSDGVPVEATWEGSLVVNALVADVTISDSVGTFDPSRPDGRILAGHIIGFTRYFRKYGETNARNSGNVDLTVRFIPNDMTSVEREKLLIPGDTLTVPSGAVGWIRMSRTEAVRDPVRLPLEPDGHSYYYLRNGE